MKEPAGRVIRQEAATRDGCSSLVQSVAKQDTGCRRCFRRWNSSGRGACAPQTTMGEVWSATSL